jgi:hypothetical protein
VSRQAPCSLRLSVRTPPFHGGESGSIPLGSAKHLVSRPTPVPYANVIGGTAPTKKPPLCSDGYLRSARDHQTVRRDDGLRHLISNYDRFSLPDSSPPALW